jgi:gluconokinase
MGVSGAGKSTLGRALAARLGWDFQEGDDLHPPANIAKMSAGLPLTDDDRAPWLVAVAAWIEARIASGQGGVVACSALKAAYRAELTQGQSSVRLVYLRGSKALIADRVARRTGHFMPPSLIDSQFAALEPPAPQEGAIVVSARASLTRQVAMVVAALNP